MLVENKGLWSRGSPAGWAAAAELETERNLRKLMRYRALWMPSLHSCMMLDCVNPPRYGGFSSLVPTASLVGEDVLDVIVVEYTGAWRLLGHLAASLADRLLQRPGVTTFEAKEMILDSVQPPIAQLDGDPFTLKTPLTIEVAPDAIKVIAPPSFNQKQSA